MNQARATYSRRGWVVLGAVLLMVFFLWMLVREGGKGGSGSNTAIRAAQAESTPAGEAAGEKARRAAIAALGPIKSRGVNAAGLYRQAMALYAGLTDEEKSMLNHWRDKPDPKKDAALYAKIQPIMDLMRRARKADYADWGLGQTDFSGRGGQFKKEQDLVSLAFWDAAYRFQSDPDGAVGDIAVAEALGRSSDDSLLGLLLSEHFHSGGIWLLAQNAGSITSAAGPDLAYLISPAEAEQSFQNGMNGDVLGHKALLAEYANPLTQGESDIQKWAVYQSVTPGALVSEFKWMIQTEQALGTTLSEPDAQFQQWWSQKLAEAASMPLATSQALPALEKSRNQMQTVLAEDAMLEAGMALEQNNQAQFQSILDPASGKPFTYTQKASGFQLGSALQNAGKPVTLNFSTPAAK
jgi:hypothetical protein